MIRADNGPPFASTGVTGLTALSVWWTRLGIRHERVKPGGPQQNGRHERFHLTLEAMRPASPDQADQVRRFTTFRQEYNHQRPHEALGQIPPASLYRSCPRPLPDRLPEPVYPPEAAVRKVRSNGEVKWRGGLTHVSSALIGDAVAVEETEDGKWQVRFCERPLGVIDPKTNRLGRLLCAPAGADPETAQPDEKGMHGTIGQAASRCTHQGMRFAFRKFGASPARQRSQCDVTAI